MKERIPLYAVACLICFAVLSPVLVAQNNPACQVTMTWWPVPDGKPPLGWTCCFSYPGALVAVVVGQLASCKPPSEAQKSCPAKSGPPPCTGSLPIYFTTGDTYIEENDVSLPGLGGGINLSRRWNSMWPINEMPDRSGIFGVNWKSTYEEKIFMGVDGYVKYGRGDGDYWSFGFSDQGVLVVASPANASATLSEVAGKIDLTFQNGEQRLFDPTTGFLIAIIDRNGNATQLAYDTANRLSTVTDPALRHLYFNYLNGSTLVTSITSDFGVSLSYTYDSLQKLIQVTRPDQTTINFTYDANSRISQVTDSNGKVLESHTYDSNGRGLTASQANGVNAITVTYPQ